MVIFKRLLFYCACPPVRLLSQLPPLSRVSRHHLQLAVQFRGVRTKAVHRLRLKSQAQKFTASEHRSWMLRLAHENMYFFHTYASYCLHFIKNSWPVKLSGYLSWSRNAAICAGVGATIVIVEMQFSIPMADYYAVGFTDLGLVFLTFGSIQHVYSAYRLRKLLQLSLAGYVWIVAYTSVFALIYYALVQSKLRILPGNEFKEDI